MNSANSREERRRSRLRMPILLGVGGVLVGVAATIDWVGTDPPANCDVAGRMELSVTLAVIAAAIFAIELAFDVWSLATRRVVPAHAIGRAAAALAGVASAWLVVNWLLRDGTDCWFL